jgi:hypothetical protein
MEQGGHIYVIDTGKDIDGDKIYKIGKTRKDEKYLQTRYGVYLVKFEIVRFVYVDNVDDVETILKKKIAKHTVKGELVNCRLSKIDKLINKAINNSGLISKTIDKLEEMEVIENDETIIIKTKNKHKCEFCSATFTRNCSLKRHYIRCKAKNRVKTHNEQVIEKIEKVLHKKIKKLENLIKEYIEESREHIKESREQNKLLIKMIKKLSNK